MILYSCLALCAFLAALLVYRYDLYQREPFPMLLLAAAAGAVTMHLLAGIELFFLSFVSTSAAVAMVAAWIEELARVAVVSAIAAVFPRYFDDPMDGIVYGSIVGLGMGIEESLYLLNLLEAPNLLTLPVEVVRLLGHLIMGGISGFGIGVARIRMAGWPRALARSLAVAVLLHFLWDFLALEANGGGLSGVQTLIGIAVMLSGILFYGMLVVLGSRLSREIFAPVSARSLWGWPFSLLFDKPED